jgi:hypothetical protein
MQLHKLTQILLLAGFISLLFLPALGGGYLLDDENNFVSNSNVQLEFGDSDFLSRAANSGIASELGRPLSSA